MFVCMYFCRNYKKNDVQYQGKVMMQPWQKPKFGPNLEPPNFFS